GSLPRPQYRRSPVGGLAPGYGRDDGDGLALGHLGVEALEEAHVLVGHEDVHEPAQLAAVVEEAVAEAGMGLVKGREQVGHGVALDRDLRGAPRQRAQLGGHPHGGAHSSTSKAAAKASMVGAMVAVGPTSDDTASRVFKPWPVT